MIQDIKKHGSRKVQKVQKSYYENSGKDIIALFFKENDNTS
jgi:hypothetical protein